jgi:hypothetical protein
MKRAIVSFEPELVYDPRRFDPARNLVVAWYDPASGKHHHFCEHFASAPRSARKLTAQTNAAGEFQKSEIWSLEADISYDHRQIDIDTARLDVLEFDQESGSMLATPVNVQIIVRSQRVLPRTVAPRGKPGPPTMDQILEDLLAALEAVQEESPELTDTEAREAMAAAVWHLFIAPQAGYKMPKTFFLDSARADGAVRRALQDYVRKAAKVAEESGLPSWRERLAALQNPQVASPGGYVYDDFFGWTDPGQYEANDVSQR